MVRTVDRLLQLGFLLDAALGVLLFLGLLGTFPFAGSMFNSLRAHHSLADSEAILGGVRLALITGVFAAIAGGVILSRLILMVRTVALGDPFTEANAKRLLQIAWSLLIFQLLNIVFQYADWDVGRIDGGSNFTFSLTGWVAVLVAFVLARVFALGTRMRDDLAGTV